MRGNSETRFAVEWVVGDDVTVLKIFGEDEKQAATDYAREIAKELGRGLVDVIRAAFVTETQRIAGNGFAIYEGFHAGRRE